MSEWRAIETAPKDGKAVDLWVGTYSKSKPCVQKSGKRVIDAFYQPMPYNGWRWAVNDYRYGKDVFDAVVQYTDDREERATHWMRVEPPKP